MELQACLEWRRVGENCSHQTIKKLKKVAVTFTRAASREVTKRQLLLVKVKNVVVRVL